MEATIKYKSKSFEKEKQIRVSKFGDANSNSMQT
jgi:hypothetical protein